MNQNFVFFSHAGDDAVYIRVKKGVDFDLGLDYLWLENELLEPGMNVLTKILPFRCRTDGGGGGGFNLSMVNRCKSVGYFVQRG